MAEYQPAFTPPLALWSYAAGKGSHTTVTTVHNGIFGIGCDVMRLFNPKVRTGQGSTRLSKARHPPPGKGNKHVTFAE
ncbi:MAG: hypothetical protein QOE26_1930 [Verrucomicrobiota bacterium]|jgi:hypothetical protein